MLNHRLYDEEDEFDEDNYGAEKSVEDNNDNNYKEFYEMDTASDDEKDSKQSSLSERFLNNELSIKVENFRTTIKFEYHGEKYKGIVIKKLNSEDYIFLLQKYVKRQRNSSDNEKVLKKIHVPDASLI